MNHVVSHYYKITTDAVRALENPHQSEAPSDAPFLVIGPNSPLAWRRAVEHLANYFRRELKFDFPPYQAEHNLKCAKDRVLVFRIDESAQDFERLFFFIGAVGVRWVEWSDMPASWSVEWAWFHPYERHRGHLQKAWPFILQMFPEPWVRLPLSPAMIGFLKKVGYTKPLDKSSA